MWAKTLPTRPPDMTCRGNIWTMKPLRPCSLRRRNTWAIPMYGAEALRPRPLTAPASCPGSSITAAGMWAACGPRGSITSAPLPAVQSPAIWCSLSAPMTRRAWAKVYNLKQMAAALQYLREHDLMDYDALASSTEATVDRAHKLAGELRDTEAALSKTSELMGA